MSTTKIHINLKQGILEAEGTELFVEKIYRDFKDGLSFNLDRDSPKNDIAPDKGSQAQTKKKTKKPSGYKSKAKPKSKVVNATIVKDLDLTGGGKVESLRDFYGKYTIKTNIERNLVFSYYLEYKLKEKDFGIDHIFTCYRNIPDIKIPGNLKQSLYDTSYKGWISVESVDNDISVPITGINYIEHDLPKAEGSTS